MKRISKKETDIKGKPIKLVFDKTQRSHRNTL
jgi:hypothetical protein